MLILSHLLRYTTSSDKLRQKTASKTEEVGTFQRHLKPSVSDQLLVSAAKTITSSLKLCQPHLLESLALPERTSRDRVPVVKTK